jgi:hypothetical protein
MNSNKLNKLSSYQPYRELQVLKLAGTKKQIKAYWDAKWKATPLQIQELIISGSCKTQPLSTWLHYHKIGYSAAKKAGYNCHYLVTGQPKPKAKKQTKRRNK